MEFKGSGLHSGTQLFALAPGHPQHLRVSWLELATSCNSYTRAGRTPSTRGTRRNLVLWEPVHRSRIKHHGYFLHGRFPDVFPRFESSGRSRWTSFEGLFCLGS